ncbi:tellurite resistance TerB family protein [Chiayiivirga flava]|uniref:Uncharacterized membrane protein YebE (DUF533 family) n=1 Tax=Chiayiivirga flava TaxID=659595 RepID=A0A7W8FZJ7_9GAMM|nr:DUF533 domain-containing protein [Chiayiivirga flava]MBB5207294.1 uncharacterized membrane protein YebE (DUF533 family) [Chiayiivirga flava]
MFDPERLLGQMLGGSLGDAFGGKRGKRKRSAFSTGSLGGKATLGVGLLGVAMAAWEHYSQNTGNRATTVPPGGAPAAATPMPPPPPSGSAMPPPPPAAAPTTRAMPVLDDRQQSVVLLIRAMIAAANADGHIDATERESILGRARDSGLDADTLAFLDAELAKPQTLQQVVANGTPALAADIYAASALAITVDTEAEKQWLDMLSYGLRLDPAVRADIDARIAAPQ